jgi:hypothetical protein
VNYIKINFVPHPCHIYARSPASPCGALIKAHAEILFAQIQHRNGENETK